MFAVRILGQDYCMESCFGARPVMYGDVVLRETGGMQGRGGGLVRACVCIADEIDGAM